MKTGKKMIIEAHTAVDLILDRADSRIVEELMRRLGRWAGPYAESKE